MDFPIKNCDFPYIVMLNYQRVLEATSQAEPSQVKDFFG